MRKFKSVGGRVKLRLPQRPNILILKYKHIGIEMVRCPAGSFMMGSPEGELGRKDNEVHHQITINHLFYIGRYPVTQKLYRAVMGENPSCFKGKNNPVEQINWFEAKEFCNKLNKNAKNIPKGYKFDLPSEAQWEYACRAGTTTALNNDKVLTTLDGVCPNLNEIAWYRTNSNNKTHPVGLKKPNVWGIFDMLGNVFELCDDYWNDDYSSKSYVNLVRSTDDLVSFHAMRGSCARAVIYCRSAMRSPFLSWFKAKIIGFRVALVPINE